MPLDVVVLWYCVSLFFLVVIVVVCVGLLSSFGVTVFVLDA